MKINKHIQFIYQEIKSKFKDHMELLMLENEDKSQVTKVTNHNMFTSKISIYLCIIKQNIKKRAFLHKLFTML